ncbi:MAG TPA: phosphoribosylaminoimidazolesuccinocarboxamide synthase [bacterium]|nr:phosphoribosylaminoimidazolesuccinocarboxamide synthase [bacterium]HPR86795.1 phosphoribosylaminoimidazolesuccinocarboxamide synthase [bacterium]
MKKKKVYEGKTKKVYEAEHESELVLEFKDDAISLSGSKAVHTRGKGSLNNQMSIYMFRLLDSYHISTHFIREISDKEMLVKKLAMIPVVVMVHDVAAGKLVKSYGLPQGKELECPIIEYYLKDDERDDPMINEDHIVSFGHATSTEIKEMHRLASKINAILKAFLRRRELQLVDIRIEFGRYQNRLLIADEISLNTIRTIDLQRPEMGILDGDNPMVLENLPSVKNRIFTA